MSFDDRCFAAGLLGLGSRGFLKIRQFGSRYRVERTGKQVDWLAGEQELARRLLPGERARIDIEQQHDPAIQEARARFAAAIEQHFGEKLFSKNHGSLYAGLALTLVAGMAMFAFDTPTFLAGVLVFAMLLALFAFSFWLPAYSVQGRKLQDAIEGLRAPPQTREEFAKFLPYAVALGVEKTWADRFAHTLGAAAVADYYSSDSVSGFSGSLSDFGGTIASATTPPGSDSGW